MESLKELVTLINKYKLTHIGLVGWTKNKKSLMNKFYDKLSKEEILSDAEAARLLYNSHEKNKNYKSLKIRLTEKLINALFLIDGNQSKYCEKEIALTNCWKNLAAAKILMQKYAFTTALDILEKNIKVAKKHELTDVMLETSKMLRHYYGFIAPCKERFATYNAIYKKYLKQYLFRTLIEEHLGGNIAKEERSGFTRNGSSISKPIYHQKINALINTCESPEIHTISHCLALTMNMEGQNLRRLLDVYRKANQFIELNEKPTGIFSRILLTKQIDCSIRLNRIECVEKLINKSSNFSLIGSNIWFVQTHLIIQFYLRTEKYEEALKVFRLATKHIRFKVIPDLIREKLNLEGALIHLLNKWKVFYEDKFFAENQFRLSKFLNETQALSKDKAGWNIMVIVLEFSWNLTLESWDELTNKAEGMIKYAYRYLNTNENKRGFWLFKILSQIPMNAFKKGQVLEDIEKYVQKLESCSEEKTFNKRYLELIPYERFIEFLIQRLN